jgi:hypothetical protein
MARFDRLISMLWSGTEDLRKKAENELIECMKKTMSSSYGLSEEDYMHPLLDSSSKKFGEVYIGSNRNLNSKQNDFDNVCKIVPTVVPD